MSTSTLRVRQGPGIDYQILDGLTEGTCVTFDARNADNTWGRIMGSGGWVSLQYIQSASTASLPVSQSTYTLPNSSPQTSQGNTSSSPTIVDASRAYLFIGQTVTVRISPAYCEWVSDVRATFCNDYYYPAHNFTYLIWNGDLSSLNGNCLLVTGLVSIFDGLPQIVAGAGTTMKYC